MHKLKLKSLCSNLGNEITYIYPRDLNQTKLSHRSLQSKKTKEEEEDNRT